MTRNRFDLLSIYDRAKTTWDEGEFIASREYYNHRVGLYALKGFFVEVHYLPDSNEIDQIHSVKDENVLNLYIDSIPLQDF